MWTKLAAFCLVFLVCTAAVWQDTQQYNVTKTAASYTTVVSDYYIGVTSTAAARTISTTAEDQLKGRVVVLKDESNAAGTNNITFDPAGAVTVDGAATKVISTNSGALRLICDGTNWFSF
jgi:hypothetical protein